MSNISSTDSTYGSGGLDTRTTLDDTYDATFQQMNGAASGVIAIEAILGDGPTLKGSLADLVTRLAVLLNTDGTLKGTGFSGLTTDYGLLAISPTEMDVINHTPIGLIMGYGGAVAPLHWLLCDGSEVDRITYAKLFTVISTIYGIGDGANTFNLPDGRGRTLIGVDGSANRITAASTDGANADTLGGVGGAETHTLTTPEIPSHTHTEEVFSAGSGFGPTITAGSDKGLTPVSALLDTAATGGGLAHSNTQPWLAINYIIFAGV